MLEFDKRHKCFVCTACKSICPQQAIEMIENEEGFLEPKIIEEKCIKCGLCERKCPAINYNQKEKINPLKVISAYKKNSKDYKNYTSGGVFIELAKKIIEENGYVCGCIWNDNMEAEHILTNNISEIEKMQTSKYVQSNLKDCIKRIKELTKDEIKVLFTGTACQIAAVKSVLEDNDLIYTCEIVCHGVPSPKVWRKYVGYMEKKTKSKIKNVNFRFKGKYGWITPFSKYYFENGKEKRFLTYNEDVYLQGFSKSLFYRKSCYNCIYKGKKSLSDVIIGDFWGCPSKLLENNHNKGISIVLINNEKGKRLFDKISEHYIINEEVLEDVIKENSPIIKPVEENDNRQKFFEDLIDISDEKMVENIKKLTFNKNTYIKQWMYKLGILEKLKMNRYRKKH